MTFERFELTGPIKAPCYQHCKKRLFPKYEPSSSRTERDTHANIRKIKRNFWTSKSSTVTLVFDFRDSQLSQFQSFSRKKNCRCFYNCIRQVSSNFQPILWLPGRELRDVRSATLCTAYLEEGIVS